MLGAAVRWSFTCWLPRIADSDLFLSLSVWQITRVNQRCCISTSDTAGQEALLRPWVGKGRTGWTAATFRSCVWGWLTCVDRNGKLQQKNRLFPVGLGGLRTRGEHHLAHKRKVKMLIKTAVLANRLTGNSLQVLFLELKQSFKLGINLLFQEFSLKQVCVSHLFNCH